MEDCRGNWTSLVEDLQFGSGEGSTGLQVCDRESVFAFFFCANQRMHGDFPRNNQTSIRPKDSTELDPTIKGCAKLAQNGETLGEILRAKLYYCWVAGSYTSYTISQPFCS